MLIDIGLGLQVQVTDSDQCSICTQLKSQQDCENQNNTLGCEWKNTACVQKTAITYKEYCEQITDPATMCAKTFGCAYIDSKCTHFTGCTAYVKTTLSDCQAISNQCITNGVTCDDIQLCKDYSKEVCESSPSPVSPFKCKLDGDACRDYKCSEADTTLASNSDCNSWLSGCITTGLGCIDVLPNCNEYTGTQDTCNKRLGKDGKCTLDSTSTTTPQTCKLRVCSEAVLTTWDDTSCNIYKTGCKSTGFSCVDSFQACSTYKGTATTCLNFIGQDGKCAADATATTCRARKCEDKVSGSLTDCIGYLGGCKTNGVSCVTALGNCSTYKGTTSTCKKYTGLDGNCKGTSVTDATASCAVKTCADDELGTEATDTACQLIQSTCKTTGKGCVASLQSCTTYTDDGNCLKYIGSDGKCKAGPGGDSPKCAARACTDNTTATTNTECQAYLQGCVTNGSGCAAETNCTDTISKIACLGTTNNFTCGWTESCVSKDCTAFSSSQSFSLKLYAQIQKVQMELKNVMMAQVVTCSDAPYTSNFDSNAKCDAFLAGCITKGSECVDSTNVCSTYSGTGAQCSALKGNSIPCLRVWLCSAPPLTCSNITNATTHKQCETYYSSCQLTYGTTKCQDRQASCDKYVLTGSNNADKNTYCNQVKTSIGGHCAYDPTTSDNCVTRSCNLWALGLGETCTDYAGTATCTIGANQQCFTLGDCSAQPVSTSLAAADRKSFCNNQWDAKGRTCTYDITGNSATCKSIATCEDVVNPTAQDNCYFQSQQTNCIFIANSCKTFSVQTACTGYNVQTLANNTDKATVCSGLNSVNSGTRKLCKFDTGTPNTCIDATCEDIVGPTKQSDCNIVSVTSCHYYASKCYTITACASYIYPSDVTTKDDKTQFCQNMYNTGGTEFCSYGSAACGGPDYCSSLADLDNSQTTAEKTAICNKLRDKAGSICTYEADATACSMPLTDVEKCSIISSDITQDQDCDTRTIPNFCKVSSNTCVLSQTCDKITEKTQTACQKVRAPDGYYCIFQTGNNCSVAKDDCTGWAESTTLGCSDKKDKYGNQCKYVSGSSCSNPTCDDAVSPTSQLYCDKISSGCVYYFGMCLINKDNCTQYNIPTSANDNSKRQHYCNGRVTSSGGLCTYQGTTSCVPLGACSSYSPSGSTFTDKQIFCAGILTTDNYDCTYASGNNCMKTAALCTSYTGMTTSSVTTDCAILKDTLGRSCAGVAGATACSYPVCSAITGAKSQSNCDSKAPGCVYSNNACTIDAPQVPCNELQTGGRGAIAFCNAFKDSNGVQCYATDDAASTCTARACNDPQTLYFTTSQECQAYSPLCKSDGKGCINNTNDCASFWGDINQCSWLTHTDGITPCAVSQSPNDIAACKPSTCEMNLSAISQTDCDNYIPGGNCRFKNPGCYDQSVPCNQYRGTATECSKFIGNKITCIGDSATRGACRDKTCADKSTATDDNDCSSFLTGCIFNGVGCIDKSSTCDKFKGTITTCKNYKGANGKTLCWGTQTTQATCVDRQCSQLQGASDADCEAHFPNSHCITDGTKCVVGPKQCADFQGNDTTCSKLTASDGPCKASSVSSSPVACTPRVCNEAPNTYNTDQQCQDYYPQCKTNGRGCQSSLQCSDLQNKTTCSANNTCLWASSCRATSTSCSSLTSQGSSVCVNNPAKKCAWYTGNGTNNAVCRDYQCADYDATLTTHDACMKTSNNACTTTGAGCVTYSTCSTYTSSSICSAAQTTELSKKCTWENAKCRQQQCKDLQGTTDDECNTKLSGCKSNGTNCIGSIYDCSVFNGSQKYCLSDSSGQPCLYVNGICYAYDNCTDITQPTQQFCSLFSTNCVVGTSTCIALNQCSKYNDQVSCYSGINKSICGWTPDQKCAEFKQCGDIQGTTLTDCMAWNNNCVSDGTGCVPIGECQSYLKQLSCENNYDTTSNACFWTGTACRLKQCSDVTAATDADCVINIVKEGVCTTDGTKCVIRADCKSYSSQGACTIGSDGIPCLYGYAVGQTTGTQSCRPQECTDIIGTSNDQCIGKINKKACVSNGINCVAQGTCASYKNKLSCAGGGSDNSQCVFTATPTTSGTLAGTCVAFTQCANANGDQVTCLTNKSCKYTDATKKCETTDCGSFNPSGTTKCSPFPSFDGKTFTLCVSSATGCSAGDPTALQQADCYSTVSRYAYTWNTNSNKCQKCKGSSSSNNSSSINNTNDTTTDNGYVLEISMALALMGFMA